MSIYKIFFLLFSLLFPFLGCAQSLNESDYAKTFLIENNYININDIDKNEIDEIFHCFAVDSISNHSGKISIYKFGMNRSPSKNFLLLNKNGIIKIIGENDFNTDLVYLRRFFKYNNSFKDITVAICYNYLIQNIEGRYIIKKEDEYMLRD